MQEDVHSGQLGDVHNMAKFVFGYDESETSEDEKLEKCP